MVDSVKLPDNCKNDAQESTEQALETKVEDEPKEEIALVSVGDYPNDATRVAEHDAVDGGADEKTSDNDMEARNPAKSVEEKLNDYAADSNENKSVKGNGQVEEEETKTTHASPVTNGDLIAPETAFKHGSENSAIANQSEFATPNSLAINTFSRDGDHSSVCKGMPLMEEGRDATADDQAAFMKELESFYRERSMDFKPPKFYGRPLNCLKLWNAVIKLGGYDRVTGAKLWKVVGESFYPPKTCTTVSWTFRIFYEKSLLEYEKHKIRIGDLPFEGATLPEASSVVEANDLQRSATGRARRDAAARAMQGWQSQRRIGYGEVEEAVVKNTGDIGKHEKNLKGIGSVKQKRPNEVEYSIKAIRTATSRQLMTTVVDAGPPADWVKVNVLQAKDGFEVYALVPGLLRDEVVVESDPAGRLVITGQPEQVDNPWGVTAFKKVISLPTRIDPLGTNAVVSLQGALFVHVPFERK